MKKWKSSFFAVALGLNVFGFAANQTETISPVFPEDSLPYRVEIKLADFTLPVGIQSFASATYKGKWVFVAGRAAGLHGFTGNDFPPSEQNTLIFVVDPKKKKVFTRSITDPSSGLTQEQIDQLSATNPENYQSGKTLYMTGGFGIDTATGLFTTKKILTAFDLPGVIHWVTHPHEKGTLAQHIRQLYHPIFQITGGAMFQIGDDPTLLIFGQNFSGPNVTDYSFQVRRFKIFDNGKELNVKVLPFKPKVPDPNFRRRDFNVIPIIQKREGRLQESLVQLSGGFTPTDGAWTVPVSITANGSPFMPDPNKDSTFKQGMNLGGCPNCGLFSCKTSDMYTLLFGGLTFGFFQNGQFMTDPELPFTNEVTTLRIDKKGRFSQYIMNAQYPVILSTGSNPGNKLLFGSSGTFMPIEEIPHFKNGVFKLDAIKKPTLVGYIVGGIASTLPNTIVESDSTASQYIFKVIVRPIEHGHH